jgi:predicted nucleic acid-binding protein
LVVDASTAIKWFVPELWHREALALLLGEEPLAAPDIIVAEIANIAWKKALQHEITPTPTQALDIAMVAPQGFSELRPSSVLVEQATHLALELEHPVYDCLYLACAAELGTSLVTADERLVEAVRGTALIHIVHHVSQLRGGR